MLGLTNTTGLKTRTVFCASLSVAHVDTTAQDKAHKPYECGVKVRVVSTSKESRH
ncbi:MAG: hypothetical protein ABI167_05345 [Nitrosospira sp.]